jgi:hypothetical protein
MDNWGEIQESEQLDEDDMWGSDMNSEISDGEDNQQQFENTFEQEQSAAASSGQSKSCGDPIPFHIKPGTKEYSQAIANKTPLERFKLEVDYVSRILTDSGNVVLLLSVNDRDIMCERANDTDIVDIDPKYLNPLAFILGYIAHNMDAVIIKNDTDKEIKKKIVKMRSIIGRPDDNFSDLKVINDSASKARSGNSFSVFPADVIRYAQMWNKLK